MSITSATTGRTVRGKPIVDMTLLEIGVNLKRTMLVLSEAKKQARALELEQDKRIRELAETEHLQVVDTGNVYQVVNPRSAPSEFQAEILEMFGEALERDDPALLDQSYQLAMKTRCQYTNWTTEFREGVQSAYARRMSEIQGEADEAV